MSIAKSLRIIQVLLNLQDSQNFALAPNTSTYATIIFESVRKGLIKIFPVGTSDQIADVLTKALAQNDFMRHRIQLCGK
jgi:hypothetical protein